MGGLEPITADTGRGAGYTLDRLPVNHRADTEADNHSRSQQRVHYVKCSFCNQILGMFSIDVTKLSMSFLNKEAIKLLKAENINQ